MDTLVLPTPLLRSLLRRVLDSAGASLFLAAGLRAVDGHRDWLAREIVTELPASATRVFEVHTVDLPAHRALVPTRQSAPPRAGLIVLGTGDSRGHIAAVTDGMASVDEVFLVGPGMHRIDLRSHARDPTVAGASGTAGRSDDCERWSRTMGALGGEDAWRRLVNLRMAVVGVGRSGSLIARSLAAIGVRHLTLIDPDVVELHNLGESDALQVGDIGLPKAVAMSRRLRYEFSGRNSLVYGIHGSVWGDRGVDVVKQSDVIVSCVDRDAPRLAAALIATAHHRVLVDVGTGVLPEDAGAAASPDRRHRMGADVRVILPGEGCLLCRGGLTDYDRAVRELAEAARAPVMSSNAGTFGRRLGSLRSLNMVAAGAALRLLEGVVTGRGRGGWMHLEDDGSGRFDIRYPQPHEGRGPGGAGGCPLCQRAGLGDAAI